MGEGTRHREQQLGLRGGQGEKVKNLSHTSPHTSHTPLSPHSAFNPPPTCLSPQAADDHCWGRRVLEEGMEGEESVMGEERADPLRIPKALALSCLRSVEGGCSGDIGFRV